MTITNPASFSAQHDFKQPDFGVSPPLPLTPRFEFRSYRSDEEDPISPEISPLLEHAEVNGPTPPPATAPPRSLAANNVDRIDTIRSVTTPLFSDLPEDQRSVYDNDEHETEKASEGRRLGVKESWVPLYLQPRTLITSTAFFAICTVVLIILYIVSVKQQGIATPHSNLYYLWTYGPVSVFMASTALWYRVEHYSNLLAPWRAMARSAPQPAQTSLLLDYISSPLRLMNLVRSIGNRHLDVFIPTLGSIALQLIIIASAALFTVENREVIHRDVELRVMNAFAAPSVAAMIGVGNSGDAFADAFGVQQFGLGLRNGTTRSFAYQQLDASLISAPHTRTNATVDVFWTDLSCELASSTYSISPDSTLSGGYDAILHASTKDCRYTHTETRLRYDKLSNYVARMAMVDCEESGDSQKRKWVVAVTKADLPLQWSTHEFGGHNVTYRWGHSTSSVCLFCEPKAGIRKALLSSHEETTEVIMVSGKETELEQVSGWTVADAIWNTTGSEDDYYSGAHYILDADSTLLKKGVYGNKFFGLMDSVQPRLIGAGFMDTDFLHQATRDVFQLVSAQYAALHLTVPSNQNVRGTVEASEERLTVHTLAFGLILTLLILMIAICGLLSRMPPRGVVPKDVSSIAALVTILARSPNVTDRVRHSGHSAVATKSRLRSGERFQTRVWRRDGDAKNTVEFSIRVPLDNHRESCRVEGRKTPSGISWWHPFLVSISGRVLAVFIPLVLIGILEATNQRFKTSNGIADSTISSFSYYAWRCLPVLVMLCVLGLFDQVDLLSRIFHPYHVLRHHTSNARQSLTQSEVGKLKIVAIYHALQKRKLGVFVAAFAALICSALPIIASGLFTVQMVAEVRTVQLQQSNWFNPSLGFYSDRTNGAVDGPPVPSLILYNNFSYPRWTFNGYALAQVRLDSEFKHENDETPGLANMLVPAVRGVSNCSVIPPAEVSHELQRSVETGVPLGLRVSWNGPTECPGESAVYTLSKSGDYSFGSWSGSQLDANETWQLTNILDTSSNFHGAREIPTQCPLAIFAIGRGHITDETKDDDPKIVEEMTMLHCRPYVESVMLNTTFRLPSFEIDSASPVPGSSAFFSEAEIIANAGLPLPFYNVYPKPLLPYLRSITGIDTPAHESRAHLSALYDQFTHALVWARDGNPRTELIGPANTPRLLSRMDTVYATIVSHLLNTQSRIPMASVSSSSSSSSTPTPLLSATFHLTSQTSRFFQSQPSTRLAQALLGILVILSIASLFLIKTTRHVLPQNPCSIGAVASFLAGSNMLSNPSIVPVGSEFMDNEELCGRGLFEWFMVGFGWWGVNGSGEEGGQGGRRFGLDIGAAVGEDGDGMGG